MTAASIVSALTALDANCEMRTLKLRTLRTGPAGLVELIKDHVQGFTRVDHGSRSTIVVSISGEDRGELWFADFARESDPEHPGRCPRLAKTGDVVSTANPATKHPGGLQGSGNLVAVPCEADAGWARIEIYDITDVRTPQLVDSFVLNNSLKEGVTQLTRSKAGWLGFAPLDEQDHLLFVGGPKFGELNGWFYRYSPRAFEGRRFAFAGNFAGKPRSTSNDAWGPQSNVAMVRTPQGAAPMVVTFGAQGAKGREALRSKIRCFSLDMANPAACGLVHELQSAPTSFDLDKAHIDDFFGANARWGSSAFVDADGELLLYFTSRNAREDKNGVYVLDILEVRCKR